MAVSSLMYLIYQFIDCAQKESIPQASTELLDRFITEHIQENITIRDLCNLYHISESTMQHQFKALFGRPPAEYIAYRKIKKAQEFLLSGKSVTETAMLLDYNSSSYFSTVFKKFTNKSPTEWVNSRKEPL